jgi:hypothetical protein
VHSELGPRIVSSFSAQVSVLVRTNLKTCLVGFVNKYDKEEFSLRLFSKTVCPHENLLCIKILQPQQIAQHLKTESYLMYRICDFVKHLFEVV